MTRLVQRLTNTGNLLIAGDFNEIAVDAAPPGGSMVFGTSGVNLQITSGLSDFAVGTGDFTIEWWQDMISQTSHPRVWSINTWPNAVLGVSIEGGANFYFWANGGIALSATLSNYLNRWVSFAIVRHGGATTVYQDGQPIATGIPSYNISSVTLPLWIGDDPAQDAPFPGLVTNFHWVTGAALYTAAYTPPNPPVMPVADTKLLLLSSAADAIAVDSSGTNKTVVNNGVAFSDSYPASSQGYGVSASATYARTFDEVSMGYPTRGMVFSVDAANPASYPGSGTTWYDTVGGRAGTLENGAVYYDPGFPAISMNAGYHTYVDFGTGFTALNASSATMSTWICPVSFPTDPNSLIDCDDGNGGWGFWLDSYGHGWFWPAGGQYRRDTGSTPVPANQWSQLTIAWDTTTFAASFYLNGQLIGIINGSNPGQTAPNVSQHLLIGTSRDATSYFYNGYMANMTLWDRALTDAEVANVYAHWAPSFGHSITSPVRKDLSGGTMQVKGMFDEVTLNTIPTQGLLLLLDAANPASYPGSGTTWYDISGNGHDATLYNGASFSSNSINFDHTLSQYAAFPSTNMFNGDLTAAGWVYVRSFQTWSRLFDFGNGAGAQNVILAVTSGTSGQPVYSTGPNLQSPVVIPQNQWVQLAATQSGTTRTLYIDGRQVAQDTGAAPAVTTRLYNYIARSNWGSDAYLDGKIANLIMWNRAFTAAEINNLYWATQPT